MTTHLTPVDCHDLSIKPIITQDVISTAEYQAAQLEPGTELTLDVFEALIAAHETTVIP